MNKARKMMKLNRNCLSEIWLHLDLWEVMQWRTLSKSLCAIVEDWVRRKLFPHVDSILKNPTTLERTWNDQPFALYRCLMKGDWIFTDHSPNTLAVYLNIWTQDLHCVQNQALWSDIQTRTATTRDGYIISVQTQNNTVTIRFRDQEIFTTESKETGKWVQRVWMYQDVLLLCYFVLQFPQKEDYMVEDEPGIRCHMIVEKFAFHQGKCSSYLLFLQSCDGFVSCSTSYLVGCLFLISFKSKEKGEMKTTWMCLDQVRFTTSKPFAVREDLDLTLSALGALIGTATIRNKESKLDLSSPRIYIPSSIAATYVLSKDEQQTIHH